MGMKLEMKFEYRIVIIYLVIGLTWISFSDKAVSFLVADLDLLTSIQTYKGWFFVVITGFLYFLFLKKHLATLRKTEFELENHKNNLQRAVEESTAELDNAIKKLELVNNKLLFQNSIINRKNSELKMTLDDLKNTQNQLFQADKMASLGILTAGVAHEINNPLNFIVGGVAGLEKYFEVEKVPHNKIHFFIEAIHTGVDRVSAIVKGLNEMSRTNDHLNEKCDVHEIIENCLLILSSHLKHRILIEKKFCTQRIFVKGNVGQLHQVFLNILMNSNQAISESGTISIVTNRFENKIKVQIIDDGCGIEKELIPKLMDPFFTTKEPGKGTGLGLAITYNVLQSHKGTLKIESKPSMGTKALIVLPSNIEVYA